MNIVYIIKGGIEYEGEEILGVYADEDAALKECDKLKKSRSDHYDWVDYDVHDLIGS